MKNFIEKFKIPTLLGLTVILFGLASGVFLILREQIILSRATPDLTPQNVTISNQTEDSVVISWQTNTVTPSFVTFGQNSSAEQTALDDRDNNPPAGGPKPHLIHYVTLKNLLPKTKYQFKIVSGKVISEIHQFETSQPFSSQTEFTPLIGSVLNGNTPLDEGIIFLSLSGASIQSALIKEGNFLIPLSKVAKTDLSGAVSLNSNMIAKLTVNSDKGDSKVLLTLQPILPTLEPIILGKDLDLTIPEKTPQPTPSISENDKYDLNGDGQVNSADYATVLHNMGKNPKNLKADLNGDGTVDQKDLDLMSQKLQDLGSQ